MAYEREDVQSESSWAFADEKEDARSELSWAKLEVGRRTRHCDEDARSDASWDLMSEASVRAYSSFAREDDDVSGRHSRCSHVASMATVLPESREELGCLDHAGKSLVCLIRERKWESALSLLRTSLDPSELAMQRDSCGDSALAWAAYKANSSSTACLELIWTLLDVCPSDVRFRSRSRFLPLHEAAWGNAAPAIATLLCAAFPGALDDVGAGQTPNEVGEYHHPPSRRTDTKFAWPSPEKTLQDALALRGDSEWLKTLVALRLPSTSELRSMSESQIQAFLGVSEPIAALLADFVSMPSASAASARAWLPCIPEFEDTKRPRRYAWSRYSLSNRQRRQRPSRGRVLRAPSELALSDDVDHLREPIAKDCRSQFAGLRRARNTRCSFKEMMLVVDSVGGMHRLELHAAHKMSPGLQRRAGEPKWPSKSGRRRERSMERQEKMDVDCLKDCLFVA